MCDSLITGQQVAGAGVYSRQVPTHLLFLALPGIFKWVALKKVKTLTKGGLEFVTADVAVSTDSLQANAYIERKWCRALPLRLYERKCCRALQT